jgi:hypothetical protein
LKNRNKSIQKNNINIFTLKLLKNENFFFLFRSEKVECSEKEADYLINLETK